jgi:hypothetical protein
VPNNSGLEDPVTKKNMSKEANSQTASPFSPGHNSDIQSHCNSSGYNSRSNSSLSRSTTNCKNLNRSASLSLGHNSDVQGQPNSIGYNRRANSLRNWSDINNKRLVHSKGQNVFTDVPE